MCLSVRTPFFEKELFLCRDVVLREGVLSDRWWGGAWCGLDEDLGADLGFAAEDAAVTVDLVGGAGGLAGVVGELDGGAAVDADQLADQADGIEGGLRCAGGRRGSRW